MKRKLHNSIVILLQYLPDKLFTYIVFILGLKYIPNINNPKSLTEKLTYIRLNKTLQSLRIMAVDRLKVREYVKEKASDCELVNILWNGMVFTEEIWNSMPKKFVIKANHGSGMNKIINKNEDNFNDIKELILKWQNIDYAKRGREWFYKDLKRYIVIEEFIEFKNGIPPDFKFFCMNGKIEFVQVDLSRFGDTHKRNLYTSDFKRINGSIRNCPQGDDIDKPILWNNAINISKKLSKDFDFIRVDLYILDDKIFFGELTNIPGNATGYFTPRSLDYEFGKKLTLSKDKD